VVSVTLTLVLVVALAIVVYSLIAGQLDPQYMQKSVYVVGSAQMTGIPTGSDPYQLLTFLPQAGDPFYLTGQATTSGTQTTLKILAPDGRDLTPDASGLTGSLYGTQLYIYPTSTANECQYKVTEVQPPPATARTLPRMVTGRYQIMLIDENVHLLANSFTADITEGTTSLPRTILTGTVTGTSYRADCSQTGGTCPNGCPPISNISPCNTTYSTYNGTNYLTFPDDPTLQYTGDTTIAVMIQPTTTGLWSTSANWHQIIGKGVIYPNGTEVDNYQLFQLGDRLYFEWNDAVTGIHYHAMTPTGIVTAGQWDQLNVVVQNGNLAIYNNGVSQPLTYYQSNVPGNNPLAGAPPGGVNLLNVSNDVTVGKQNGNNPSNDFNFNGNIGAISLYDRAFSQAEVTSDLCP